MSQENALSPGFALVREKRSRMQMMTDDDLKKITLFGERFGQSHAIEAVNFVIRFNVPIDTSDIARFDEAQDELKELFPLVEDLHGLQIQLGPAVGVLSEPLKPKVLTDFNRDGTQRWAARFGEYNQIVVESRSYRRWEEDWPEAEKRLDELLACVDGYKPVQAIEYAVTDTFIAQTNDGVLNPANLFAANDYVPAHIFENSDPRWDVSHGWFIKRKKNTVHNTLIRLDARGFIENDQTFVNITNIHSHRLLRSSSIKSIKDKGLLSEIFNKFHDLNKEFMRKILCEPLLRRMQLWEKQ